MTEPEVRDPRVADPQATAGPPEPQEFVPAEAFPVRDTIVAEMFARDWSPGKIARRMGGDFAQNMCILELIFATPDMTTEYVAGIRLGQKTAQMLERAFGISAECWLRTDEIYRQWRTRADPQATKGGTPEDRGYTTEDFVGGEQPEGGFKHVCGMRGYDPMRDPICPACHAAAELGATKGGGTGEPSEALVDSVAKAIWDASGFGVTADQLFSDPDNPHWVEAANEYRVYARAAIAALRSGDTPGEGKRSP